MVKRPAPAFFLMSILLLGGCAKTVLVPFAPEDSRAYLKAKSIFAVLKTAEIYEMENVSVRADSLVGMRVFRDESGVRLGAERTAIALDDVRTIQVAKTPTFGAALAGIGLGFVLSTAAAGLILVWIVATSLNHL